MNPISTLPNAIKKTFQYGSHTVILETGAMARQASGAVLVSMGDTKVLVTVVGAEKASVGIDFLPLTVNYQERTYAAGRIPGGYFKREGRPSEKETLTSRLIDRPIRPLFPEGYYNETQIVATVLSLDPEVDADIVALIGASAALAVSGIPFEGPIGAARVGYIENNYVLNPSAKQLTQSSLDLVVAGTETAVLMVESEAKELSEEVMLGAVVYGHEQMQTAINAIKELATEAGKPARNWQMQATDPALIEQVEGLMRDSLTAAYQLREKRERKDKIEVLRNQLLEQFKNDENAISEKALFNIFAALEEKIVRGRILAGMPRIDGRDTRTVRPISISTGLLPRAHGSALFTRGETQALVVATLGTDRDAQIVDYLEGEARESFMLHYNFPPYSVGEIGQVGSPKRREIGHGRLAKRGIQAVLPTEESFPYVLRVVSEITESNGSSSMASVCGASLALMNAGVPLKAPVAGIAMGLIKEGNRYAILTDILGDEDHLGDMDFKVAGTAEGVTALQMDIKINGITKEIMESALQQAREGRLHILGEMSKAVPNGKAEMSDYAPRVVTMRINPEKIRDLIGKGGATIRAITEETGTLIDINDDGLIRIATSDKDACQAAMERIKHVTADVEVGIIYDGTVVKLTDFGAFVNIMPGRDGLLHISQISHERVERVSDRVQEGQAIRVKVLEVDKQGRIRLSMKDLVEAPAATDETMPEAS